MSDFKLEYVSNITHNHLMIEVLFRGQRVCQISKENGDDKIEIEILMDHYILEEEVDLKFLLSDFESILREARIAILSAQQR